MAVETESLGVCFHRFEAEINSRRARTAEQIAENSAKMVTKAFLDESSIVTHSLLALWNLQRRVNGLSSIEARSTGAETLISTVNISGKKIPPERRQLVTDFIKNIKPKQLSELGRLLILRYPHFRQIFRLPSIGRQQEEIKTKEFGFTSPKILIIDVTQRCNLSPEQACPRCFNDSKQEGKDIVSEEFHQLIKQCRFMGTGAIMFSGGEPFLLSDMILREATLASDLLFYVFTNGKVLAENPEIVEQMPGNLIPILNITPCIYFDKTSFTEEAQKRVQKAAKSLSGRLFMSALAVEEPMVRSEDFPVKLNDFLGHIKPIALILLPYMPIGRASDRNLTISDNRSRTLDEIGKRLTNVPLVFTEQMLKDTGIGCPAGVGLGHILPLEGHIRLCPFSTFGIPFDSKSDLGLIISWSRIGELTNSFRNASGCAVYNPPRETFS